MTQKEQLAALRAEIAEMRDEIRGLRGQLDLKAMPTVIHHHHHQAPMPAPAPSPNLYAGRFFPINVCRSGI